MEKEILKKVKKGYKGWNRILITMFPEIFIETYKKRSKRWF